MAEVIPGKNLEDMVSLSEALSINYLLSTLGEHNQLYSTLYFGSSHLTGTVLAASENMWPRFWTLIKIVILAVLVLLIHLK